VPLDEEHARPSAAWCGRRRPSGIPGWVADASGPAVSYKRTGPTGCQTQCKWRAARGVRRIAL